MLTFTFASERSSSEPAEMLDSSARRNVHVWRRFWSALARLIRCSLRTSLRCSPGTRLQIARQAARDWLTFFPRSKHYVVPSSAKRTWRCYDHCRFALTVRSCCCQRPGTVKVAAQPLSRPQRPPGPPGGCRPRYRITLHYNNGCQPDAASIRYTERSPTPSRRAISALLQPWDANFWISADLFRAVGARPL